MIRFMTDLDHVYLPQLKYVCYFNIKCLAEYGFQKSYPEELVMQSNREGRGLARLGLVARMEYPLHKS